MANTNAIAFLFIIFKENVQYYKKPFDINILYLKNIIRKNIILTAPFFEHNNAQHTDFCLII